MFGLLACMKHIEYIKQKFKIRLTKIVKIFMYTDSESSITIVTAKFFLTSKTALDNDSDIKSEVRCLQRKMKKFMSLQFVRSHQDDDKLFSQLSLASQLNVLMDHSAKEALSNQSKPSIQQKKIIPHLPQQKNLFSTSTTVSLEIPSKNSTDTRLESLLRGGYNKSTI